MKNEYVYLILKRQSFQFVNNKQKSSTKTYKFKRKDNKQNLNQNLNNKKGNQKGFKMT